MSDDDGKISSLFGHPIPQGDGPNKKIIEMLEETLAYAKRGELKSIAIAGVMTDGGVLTHHNAGNALFATLGGVSLLHARIIRKIEEDGP